MLVQIRRTLTFTGICRSTSHLAGIVAMGDIVNADLKGIGFRGLRASDASMFLATVAAHHMAALYAVAEQTAELID